MKLSQAIMNYVHVVVRSSHQETLLPDEMKELVKVEEDLKEACSNVPRKVLPSPLDMFSEGEEG